VEKERLERSLSRETKSRRPKGAVLSPEEASED